MRLMDKRITTFNVAIAAAISLAGVVHSASAAQPGVSQHGAVTKYASPSGQFPNGASIDFVNAKPMTLPKASGVSQQAAQDRLIKALMSPQRGGKPAVFPGRDGDGKESA